MIWCAERDPSTLRLRVLPNGGDHADRVDPAPLLSIASIVSDVEGAEYVVLSDGRRRLRLDIVDGTLFTPEPFTFVYELRGVQTAARQVRALRQLLHVCRHGRFSAAFVPREPGLDRLVMMLRVHDALRAGVPQRMIAAMLVGGDRATHEWRKASDSLRSRVRRLVADARAMAAGGYRRLLKGR